MSDIDRYLTDELVEKVRDELAGVTIGGGYYAAPIAVDEAEELARMALDAAVPEIIRQAKADALEAARGPYRCCPHCADDIIHDVEKDGHTVPCQLCQNDVIRRAKTDALREAAKKYQWGGWAERNPAVHADLASRRRQAEHAVAWLRAAADQIEGAAS